MKRTLRHGRPGLFALALSIAAAAAWSQPKPLNPLVARIAEPRGAAPADCAEGLSATPILRVEPSRIPAPEPETQSVAVAAPPSNALRNALQDAQTALTRNDRASFDAALVRERAIVVNYPTGGERRGAEEVLRLHEAASRVWDAQFQSPFFSQDDPVYAIVSAYSGYAAAVQRSVLTDSAGSRFYPADESRDFLTRLAGERLQRMGIRVAAATPSTSRTRTSTPAARPGTPRAATPPKKRSGTPKTSRATTPSRSASKPTAAPGASASRPRTSASTAKSSAASQGSAKKTRATSTTTAPVATRTPAPASATGRSPGATTTTNTPAPATSLTPVADPVLTGSLPGAPIVSTSSTTGAAATDSGANTDIAANTDSANPDTSGTTATSDTALSAVTETTTTDIAPAPQPRGRSILLPTILILVGLGVLIALFRASK